MLNRLLVPRGVKLQFCLTLCFLALQLTVARAQEKPYFVTYSHDLEEPGNLEIETKSALAEPEGGNQFGAMAKNSSGSNFRSRRYCATITGFCGRSPYTSFRIVFGWLGPC